MSANNSQSNINFDFTDPSSSYLNENGVRCGGAPFVESDHQRNNANNENTEILISTISGHSTMNSNLNANEIRTVRQRRHKVTIFSQVFYFSFCN